MDEITRNIIGDATSDITWMTYAELGRSRGISTASAKRLAIRRHWRRHQGNDGTARVAVPVTEAVRRELPASDNTSDDPRDVTNDVTALETALAAIREAHAGEIAALRERAEIAERHAATERQRADAADEERRLAAERADAAVSRALAADADRRAAERRADAELARAEVLRLKVEELQAVGAERDRLRLDLDTAREVLQQAYDAADGLRQADAARKGRGRLARLRAAWWGE